MDHEHVFIDGMCHNCGLSEAAHKRLLDQSRHAQEVNETAEAAARARAPTTKPTPHAAPPRHRHK